MAEKRGGRLNRWIDHHFGMGLLGILWMLLAVKRFVVAKRPADDRAYLLVCFGAIGDLIILTEAVRCQLAGKKVYLACSFLNLGAAKLYDGIYAGIEPVNIKNFLAVHKVAKKFGVRNIVDSTQWANIGPLQVGIADLFGNGVSSVGFLMKKSVRNHIYGNVIPHSNQAHELVNFVNLVAGSCVISSNSELNSVVPRLYERKARRKTGKVLIHMWPSGNRSYLKEWPEDCWIALINNLMGRGYEIFLSGAPADMQKTEEFVCKVRSKEVVNIAGLYELTELRQFIQDQIEFAVSVNTGILHLLASEGVPLIALHGPTNPVRWGPLGSSSISLLPESGYAAYLHYGFEYPDSDVNALNKLSVSQVFNAVDSLLAD